LHILLDQPSFLLKLIFELRFQFPYFVFVGVLLLNHIALIVKMTIRTQMLHAYHLIQLLVIQEKNFLRSKAIVFLGHCCVFESGFKFASSDHILTVEIVVLLEKLVEICLLIL
jgi:hypothetical protein